MFNPDFISRVAPFKTIRFMKWMNTVNSSETDWANRPTPSYVFWDDANHSGAVPAEVQIALANKIGADGWFNMPLLATDDYITQFATLVHAQLNSNLKAYVEFGNEVWNRGAIIGPVHGQLIANGYAAFPSAGNDNNAVYLYGIKRAVKTADIWKNVWAGDSNRLVRVAGGWNGFTAYNSYFLDTLATDYGGSATYWTGKAGSYFDALAVAPYFGDIYSVPDTFTLDQLFTEIMSGGLVSGGYKGGMIKQALDLTAAAYSIASQRGLSLVAYEGGQSLVDYSHANATLQNLYTAANRDPRMATAYTKLLNGWKSAGGSLFANFTLVTPSSTWGYWGVLENVLQTSSPKYDAVKNFISANPCWWNGCTTVGATTPSSGGTTTTSGGTTTPSSGGTTTTAGSGGTTTTSGGTTTTTSTSGSTTTRWFRRYNDCKLRWHNHNQWRHHDRKFWRHNNREPRRHYHKFRCRAVSAYPCGGAGSTDRHHRLAYQWDSLQR